MSEAIHFDTHKFVKRMTESGMAEPTAEALADEQMRLIQGELATKQGMEALRLATRTDMAELKYDLIKWMAGMLIAQGGVIVALLRLIPA